MHPEDHPVSVYARDVVEGRIVAGELVTMACARHLSDLETGADRGIWFDPDAADMILKFARILRHTEGALAGRRFELQPWQVFRMGSVYGWKRADGLRRFRNTYHQVGKKNGKTTDTAVPMLFSQLLDGEAAPRVLRGNDAGPGGALVPGHQADDQAFAGAEPGYGCLPDPD